MSRTAPIVVEGRDGLHGTVEDAAGPGGRATIRLDDGRVVSVLTELLIAQPDGSYRLDLSPTDLGLAGTGRVGAVGAAIGESVGGSAAAVREREGVIPIVREELDVSKRTIETGTVRVKKLIREREEVVDIPLLREEVQVERVPINRFIEGPVEARQEGETWILPLVEEVLVVEKRLMLKEELRVTRRQVEEHRPQRVTLRSEEAEIERTEIEPRRNKP